MGRGLKIVLAIVLIAIVLAGGLALYVRSMIQNPDRYLPQIVAYLQQKTGKQVAIRHIEMHAYPLTFRVYDLEIKNPKPFPVGDFLNVPQLDVAVALTPLLHKQIVIRSLVLDHPVIDFISDPDGLWNFQNPVHPHQKPTRFLMTSLGSLAIRNGTLLGSNLIDPMDTPGPVVLEVHDFSAQLKPIVFETFNTSHPPESIQGNIQAAAARFGNVHTTDLHATLGLTRSRLTFRDIDAKTFRGHAKGNFFFDIGAKNTRFDTNMHVSGIGVAYLLADFQNGPPKMTGMMEADVKLAGEILHSSNPLAAIHGNGHFTVRNGEFPSLSQSKAMAQMKRFRDPAAANLPLASFSTFAGDMVFQRQHIDSRRIGVNFYGIDLTGAGGLDEVSGGMNYRGVATVLTKQGFFIDTFARWFKGAQMKNGRLTFPLHISGTLSHPAVTVH